MKLNNMDRINDERDATLNERRKRMNKDIKDIVEEKGREKSLA